uniref:L-gulonolactone oxidase n=1 Tax=Anthurium amnicola TaxID=1678845 RepID=A0A1D1YZ68_9ARAE
MAAPLPLLCLQLVALAAVVQVLHASPPEPVVKCRSGNADCVVTNAYGAFPDRSTCRVAAVVYPADESELVAAVSQAAARKQHMKVVTAHSHSIPKLSCPGGPDGAGLVISTQKLNGVVAVDATAGRMTFQSGITLSELIAAAAREGLALPYTPYWHGVSLGGMLATGSHGSSLFGKGSAVHEYVVGMRLVVAGGRVVELREGDADLLAAKVSLGLLGVVSQVTLQLEPMFKRWLTNRVQIDVGFESVVGSFATTTEFGDLTWYPGQGRVVFRDDVRLPLSAPGKGKNDFTGFRAQLSVLLGALRASEAILEATENSDGKCLLAKVQVNTLLESGGGLQNNDGHLLEFTGYPIVGNHSDIQSSGSCLRSKEDGLLTVCGWDPRVKGQFFYQTTVSIPMQSFSAFVADVKKLRELRPKSMCGPDLNSGLLMRFIRNSTAYLGKTSDAVDVDMIYFRHRDDPGQPRLDEDVMEEVEQMALFKYAGLPHWGKNRPVGFLGVRGKYGGRVDLFEAAVERYDSEGLFSSDWTDAVLGLRGKSPPVVDRRGCALEGLCICSRDEHCAPAKGYRCRPGLVYTQARVCRKA